MKLSKEHGLNPTLAVCFYCGEETGEIALLGDKHKGEAPKHMVISFKPCTKCAEKHKGHHIFIEIEETPLNPPAKKPKTMPNPTGRWIAIKDEALTETTRKARQTMYVPATVFAKNFDKAFKAPQNNNSVN